MIKKYRLTIAIILVIVFCRIAFAEQAYVIGDEDMLQISVWGSPELNMQVPVRPDGMISFPLVGDVKASGVSPTKLRDNIEKELSKFVKSPTVSVIVTQINSFKVYVLGDGVTTPAGAAPSGVITLKKNTSLMQLLAQLGSTKGADLSNAYVLREGKRLENDFDKLVHKGDVSQDIQLKPNDVIFIPDNFEKRVTVVGAVKNPGVIQYREGLTTLDALMNTGGFTDFARQNSVLIVRKKGNEVKNIEVRMKDVINDGEIGKDVPLEPGDLVIVKTGIF